MENLKNDRCREVGQTLELLKEVVLDHWEKLVRDSIEKTLHQDSVILKDHFSDILDNLVKILRDNVMDEVELGKAHGFHRVILTNFTIQDILKEYSLLRETLIDYLYPMGEIECSKLVHKYLDIVLKNSIAEFLNDLPLVSRVEKNHLGEEIKEIVTNPVISSVGEIQSVPPREPEKKQDSIH